MVFAIGNMDERKVVSDHVIYFNVKCSRVLTVSTIKVTRARTRINVQQYNIFIVSYVT